MTTSSIFKSFVIDDKESIEKFLKAIEESDRAPKTFERPSYNEIEGEKELREFMTQWHKNNKK